MSASTPPKRLADMRAAWMCSAFLLSGTAVAAAQGSPVAPDSARSEIRTSLRLFYFNLAHRDWEALAADILPAKVVAHRPAPDALVRRAPHSSSSAWAPCPPTSDAPVDQAAITLDGDWAEAEVPHCVAGMMAVDEFRLIRFQQRWRFVYIDLGQAPPSMSSLP